MPIISPNRSEIRAIIDKAATTCRRYCDARNALHPNEPRWRFKYLLAFGYTEDPIGPDDTIIPFVYSVNTIKHQPLEQKLGDCPIEYYGLTYQKIYDEEKARQDDLARRAANAQEIAQLRALILKHGIPNDLLPKQSPTQPSPFRVPGTRDLDCDTPSSKPSHSIFSIDLLEDTFGVLRRKK